MKKTATLGVLILSATLLLGSCQAGLKTTVDSSSISQQNLLVKWSPSKTAEDEFQSTERLTNELWIKTVLHPTQLDWNPAIGEYPGTDPCAIRDIFKKRMTGLSGHLITHIKRNMETARFAGFNPSLNPEQITVGEDEWTTDGPFQGYVLSFGFDPFDSDVIYAGCDDGGGIYKSVDGGENWSLFSTGMRNVSAWTLALNPDSPNIIYGGDWYGGGIYCTIDGGETWRFINKGLRNTYVTSVAVDPQSPSVVYAALGGNFGEPYGRGVYKSLDGGENWLKIGLTRRRVFSLIINPDSPDIVYVGTDKGIYKSSDGGVSWALATSAVTNEWVFPLALDPNDPNVIYAGTFGNGIYKSTDGGKNWTCSGVLGSWIWSIAVDSDSTIFAGTLDGVYKSTDGGDSWISVNSGLTNKLVLSISVHPYVPDTVFVGTFGNGIFKSTNGGGSWREVNSGLTNSYIHSLAISPSKTIYAGTFGNLGEIEYAPALYKSADGGKTRTPSGLFGDVVLTLAFDRVTPTTMYAGRGGYRCGVYKSVDGGEIWASASSGLPEALPVWCSAVDHSNIIYVGTFGDGVYKSINGAASWRPSGLQRIYILSLVISPDNVIYAGTGFYGIYKSIDGGSTWMQTGFKDPTLVFSLAIDPRSSNVIYAGTYGQGVYKSIDGGETWIQSGLTNEPAVWCLAVDPTGTVYAGTVGGNGVYKSIDGGSTWVEISSGLIPSTAVSTLQIDPDSPDKIYAGTWAGGVFRRGYGVKLSCDDPYHNVRRGNTTTFIVKIENTGTFRDSYNVTAGSIEDIVCKVNGVIADQYNPYVISLDAGASTTFNVSAEVWESVPKGEWSVLVSALSQNDTHTHDQLDLTVNVFRVHPDIFVTIKRLYWIKPLFSFLLLGKWLRS
jgi:photosystem II stability/assembly factor-like uncharacterized protein